MRKKTIYCFLIVCVSIFFSCETVPIVSTIYRSGGSGTRNDRGAIEFVFSGGRPFYQNTVEVSIAVLGKVSRTSIGGNYPRIRYSNVLPGAYSYTIYESYTESGVGGGVSSGFTYSFGGGTPGTVTTYGNSGGGFYTPLRRRDIVASGTADVQVGKTLEVSISW